MRRLLSLFTFCVLVFGLASSAFSAQLAWDSKAFMGVDEIRPGMVGYGKTVYQGTKVETFNIVVIGVLKKLDFGFDMILIKVTSGPVVERKLQTVEGMSGSPIYINNRLIGAYAYGWNFQQEPVAGVTPIAAMLECTQPGASRESATGSLRPANKVLRIGDKLISQVKVAATSADAGKLQENAAPTTMVLCPVATPVFVSGVTDSAMKPLQDYLGRYNLRAVPGPGAMPGPPTKLEPGSAVAVSLVEGDTDMSAIGTVTYVKGDTVLAFGHPFLGMGNLSLPMSTAYVQGILSSSQASFKLASPVAQVGALFSDRQFAIGGTLGKKAQMVPVSLHLSDPSRKLEKRYQVRLVDDPTFTPFLLYNAVFYNGASSLADITAAQGVYTAHAVFSTSTIGDVEQDIILPQLGQFPPPPQDSRRSLPMGEFYQLADIMMVNPYESVKITSAKVDITYQPDLNVAIIEKITPDRTVAQPGDTVNLTVKIRPFGKPLETRQIAVKVPQFVAEPVMMVVVAGGGESNALKQLLTPVPTPEEGIKGIVRFLTKNPPAQSLFTAQMFPTPSYMYRGQTLKELPYPYIDFLTFGDAFGTQDSGGEGGDNGEESAGGNLRPTAYQFSEPVPYTLYGGKMIPITLDIPERKALPGSESGPKASSPLLSTSLSPGAPHGDEGAGGPPDGPPDAAMEESVAPWQSPASRTLDDRFFNPLHVNPYGTATTFPLPLFRYENLVGIRPLSSLLQGNTVGDDGDGKKPSPPTPGPAAAPADDSESSDAAAENDADTPDGEEAAQDNNEKGSHDTTLLTRSRPTWGITGRKDFLRGTHLGTTVTSKGTLVLMPTVRSIYKTSELLPWKIVTTRQGTYVAGWKSEKVVRITADGKGETVFPKQPEDAGEAECITALAADADGNLLIATWPDQQIRLVTPDGAVTRTWNIPGSAIWDLAVTTDGKRYSACDQGVVFLLRDNTDVPLQAVCNVPDKSVYALTPGLNGDLYLASSPRGKVYRLSATGALSAVYEAKDSVASLVADASGNLYVGTSPSCSIYRVSPDGTTTKILTGFGNGNRHVLSMKIVEGTLYATTGPAGGIYRIDQPDGQAPEVTTIFAREDLRTGDDTTSLGPESIMVNALAVDQQGIVLVAASSPGQVFKLEPRTEGTFISAVLPTPAVSSWGQLEVFRSFNPNPAPPADAGAGVTIEVRSGQTAWPDATWSPWAPLRGGVLINSPSATYAQMRASITDSANDHTALNGIRAHYLPANRAPQVKLMEPTIGAFWREKKEVRWEGKDPDGDTLIYTVYISPDGGKTWGQLVTDTPDESAVPPPPPPPPGPPAATQPDNTDKKKPDRRHARDKKKDEQPPAPPTAPPTPPKPAVKEKRETTESSFPWNTATSPDGAYLVKVIASDKYAKPTNAKSAEFISSSFIVDNTSPTISLKDTVSTWDEAKRFIITDNLTPIVGGKFCLDDGPWIAIVTEDGLFDSLRETGLLLPPDGQPTLTDGEHKLVIFLTDSAGNQLDRTIKLTVAQPAAPAAPK